MQDAQEKKMENKIGELAENALITENYQGNFPRQMPIYIVVDWETGEITAQARNYQIGGTPARQWNGFARAIQLPRDVDAEKLAADIDQYYAVKLDAIRAGWSEYYDGNNYKGRLTDDAQELLDDLEREIETTGGYLSTLDPERFTDYLIDEEIIDEDGNE